MRRTGWAALAVGATFSIIMLLRASEHTPPFLLVLFIGWVLAPFIGLGAADVVAARWSAVTRATLHGLMLAITLGSLAMYGGMIPMPRSSRPAALFLMVPLASWLLMPVAVLVAAFIARRMSGGSDGARS